MPSINIRQSGKYYEYKAIDYLESRGYKAIRIPTSSSGKQPLPDIIAIKDGEILAVEVKSTSTGRVRVRRVQLQKMEEFCKIFSFCNCRKLLLIYDKNKKRWIEKYI